MRRVCTVATTSKIANENNCFVQLITVFRAYAGSGWNNLTGVLQLTTKAWTKMVSLNSLANVD